MSRINKFSTGKVVMCAGVLWLLVGCAPAAPNPISPPAPVPTTRSTPTITPDISSCPFEESFEYLKEARSMYQNFNTLWRIAFEPRISLAGHITAMKEIRTNLGQLEPPGCAEPLNTALEGYLDSGIAFFDSDTGRFSMDELGEDLNLSELFTYRMVVDEEMANLMERLKMIRMLSPANY